MKKYNSSFLNYAYLTYRWITPLFDPVRFVRNLPGYVDYLIDLSKYKSLEKSEKIDLIDTYPVFSDKSVANPYDSHYLFQKIWALGKILDKRPVDHLDVGSEIDYVSIVTLVTKTTFLDIRPLSLSLPNLEIVVGDILKIPFKDNTFSSVSCLHVAEHIGLGRYGDTLDPEGTKKACGELARVLKKDGDLYFSLPVGKERLCFNAHRVHNPAVILEYFSSLQLVEFSGVDDQGHFLRKIDIQDFSDYNYACGLFHFTK